MCQPKQKRKDPGRGLCPEESRKEKNPARVSVKVKRVGNWDYFMAYGIVITQFVLVPKRKAKGGKIGVTRGCPITVTLIRHLFLFRGEAQGRRPR